TSASPRSGKCWRTSSRRDGSARTALMLCPRGEPCYNRLLRGRRLAGAGREEVLMAETVRLLDYFPIDVPHKAGEGAKGTRALKDAGVALIAFSGFPSGRKAQLDFFPVDPAAFRQVAKANRWKVVGPRRGFLVQGDDRIGAVSDLIEKLAGARIDVIAIDAVA